MEIPKIKYMERLPAPRTRRRDGATLTHVIHLSVTEDEARQVSELFSVQRNQSAPSNSLISFILLQIAKMSRDARGVVQLPVDAFQQFKLPKVHAEPKSPPKPQPQRREYTPPPDYFRKKRVE